jgi:hypothetical protein
MSVTPRTAYLYQSVVVRLAKSLLPHGDHLKSARVSWGDGSKIVALKSLTRPVAHAYARSGRFTIAATITDIKGHHLRVTAKEVVTGPLVGNYSGSDHSGHAASFYVAATEKSLENAYIANTALTCSVSTDTVAYANYLTVPLVPISSSGAFKTTTSSTGLVEGQPATITDTFQGRFTGPGTDKRQGAAGSYRETVTFTNSSLGSCTTNDVPWNLERDTQPTQTTAPAPQGNFSGPDYFGHATSFYVNPGGTALENAYVANTGLTCSVATDSVAYANYLTMPLVPVSSTGAFDTTTSTTGLVEGQAATITDEFRGNVESLATDGHERAAGTYRQTVTFTNSSLGTCTTNDVPWFLERDTQPTQTTTPAPQGNFSGPDYFGHATSFYVNSNGTALENAYVANTGLTCSVATDTVAYANYLTVPLVPVSSTGSFTATSSTTGLIDGQSATTTDVFQGQVESAGADGHERVAGTYRETITFTNSSLGFCTTNDVTWSLERDTQPTQSTAAAPVGNYAGTDYFGHATSFVVASGGNAIDTISVTNTRLSCSVSTDNVGGSNYININAGAVDVAGTIQATSTASVVVNSQSATINSVFSGNVESLATDGHERLTGTYRETITFTNTSLGFCTTNDVPWSAEAS